MPRILLHAEYDGSHYKGWQTQPVSDTVQDQIEAAISKLTSRQIRIYGSGRTDTGVHAEDQPFHFDLDYQPDLPELINRLNRVLPRDIAIHNGRIVPDDFHARFDATYRQYRYQLTTVKKPLLRHYTHYLYQPLNFDLIRSGLIELEGEHDFSRFCLHDEHRSSSICTVTHTDLICQDDNFWIVRIGANRFMKHMVRFIIGTLVDLSLGKMAYSQYLDLVAAKNDQPNTAAAAPAKGLILEKVSYPDI